MPASAGRSRRFGRFFASGSYDQTYASASISSAKAYSPGELAKALGISKTYAYYPETHRRYYGAVRRTLRSRHERR
jgi:hypothetical protein